MCQLVLILSMAVAIAKADTASIKPVHEFTPLLNRGINPSGTLVRGTDGNFYGTANVGGAYGVGTVFKITSAGVFGVLHNFGGLDGAYPDAAMIEGSDGNFYGTTTGGGLGEEGTTFKITPAGALTTLHSFGDDNAGDQPFCALVLGNDGNFYGTTRYDGVHDSGAIFKMTPAGVVTLLYTFTDSNDAEGPNTDGAGPVAGLTKGANGNFYGVTQYGGAHSNGTVFEITPAGKLTVLHTFSATDNFVNSDGANPAGALVKGSDNNFYGTTFYGGTGQAGTVFKITPAGVLTTLHNFTTSDDNPNPAGGEPQAALVQAANGTFYGTAAGGTHGNGVVFSITPAGSFAPIYEFSATSVNGVNGDGATPYAGLVLGSDGELYGTANNGGAAGNGTVFKLTPAGALTLLFTFNYYNADGASSSAALVRGNDGNFYGTTSAGGANNFGTVFKLTPAGVLTTVHNFTVRNASLANTDGAVPNDGLLKGSDGNFYGTAEFGGTHNTGTVFKITPAGTVTTLHSFSAINASGFNSDGAYPFAGLIQGKDGNFYGTTAGGGTSGNGAVFKLTPAGVLTTLHSFSAVSAGNGKSVFADVNSVGGNGNNSDGAVPFAALVQGTDGNFYGTTVAGGTGQYGTVFKVTPGGAFTTLHDFTFINVVFPTDTDGDSPEAALVQGSDGNFYGSTTLGGANGTGTIFKITPTGTLTTVHAFSAFDQNDDNTDGAVPVGTLYKGSDGYFYGTTSQGGPTGDGTAFKMTPAGVLVTLGEFDAQDSNYLNHDGYFSLAGLASDGEGNFYGTAFHGGSVGNGTIFEVTFAPVITSAATALADADQAFSYQITATNGPTSFGVQGLPPGLTVNTKTGVISGAAKGVGKVSLTLNAYNGYGKGSAPLVLTISPQGTPMVTSATTAYATQGSAFSYQITATNTPTKYGAQGLPPGLTVNTKTGVISGTSQGAGTVTLTVHAYNKIGEGSESVTLTVAVEGSPIITSARTASAKVGTAFSYQITATGAPTSYGVQGLPPGLTASASTGKITGKPTTAGTFTLTLHAYNTTGKGSANLTLKIAD